MIFEFIAMGVCVVVAIMILWELADPGMRRARRRARRTPVPTVQQAIEELERHAARWEALHLAGYTPVWVEGLGWTETGRCTPADAHPVGLSSVEFARAVHENLKFRPDDAYVGLMREHPVDG